MSYLVINGGKKLHGEIVNQSAKNSAVAILCACLMIRGKTALTNVPEIEEVDRILEILRSMGASVQKLANRKIIIDVNAGLKFGQIDRHASEVTRASLLLLGALSGYKTGYKLFKSGGCRLGKRTVRPHLYALEKFGVEVKSERDFYRVKNNKLRPAEIVMYESGDTPTENAVMASVLAPGKSVIKMASANYMVQDLCYFLKKSGAKIDGIGSTTLVITGVKKLKPVKNYAIMPDPIVAMTFLAAGIVTDSRLTVKNCPMDFLDLEICKLERMGQKFNIKNKRVYKNGGPFKIADIEVLPSRLKALPDKIYGRPFPGLNTDNLPLFVPILLKARGQTLVHDWVYEYRAKSFLGLNKLGGEIKLLDSHRALVSGPVKFKPAAIKAPAILRVAAVYLICMLAAKGKSILRDTYIIDRGYENLYDTLNKAGAEIQMKK